MPPAAASPDQAKLRQRHLLAKASGVALFVLLICVVTRKDGTHVTMLSSAGAVPDADDVKSTLQIGKDVMNSMVHDYGKATEEELAAAGVPALESACLSSSKGCLEPRERSLDALRYFIWKQYSKSSHEANAWQYEATATAADL